MKFVVVRFRPSSSAEEARQALRLAELSPLVHKCQHSSAYGTLLVI